MFRNIVRQIVDKFTPQFGKPKQITIRPLFDVWAKCSRSKDKLTFSIQMIYFLMIWLNI